MRLVQFVCALLVAPFLGAQGIDQFQVLNYVEPRFGAETQLDRQRSGAAPAASAVSRANPLTGSSYDLEAIFAGQFKEMITDELPAGSIMSAAKVGPDVYVLVQNADGVEDVIVRIPGSRQSTSATWGIGNHDASAIASSGSELWVMSRNDSHFLREFDLEGHLLATVAASRPPGKFYGLAIAGDLFFTSATSDDQSVVYSFDPTTLDFVDIIRTEAKVFSLIHHDGVLLAYQRAFFEYANNWLIAFDLVSKDMRRIHFLNARPWALLESNGTLFAMTRSGQRARFFPFRIAANQKVVVGRPEKRRVEITYEIKNKSAEFADLWIPYPADRAFQQVSDVHIAPKPLDVVTDAFGNRWAYFHWDDLSSGGTAVSRFELIRVEAAFTLDGDMDSSIAASLGAGHAVGREAPSSQAVKRNSRGQTPFWMFTKETHSFDYSKAVISEQHGNFKQVKLLDQIVTIRNWVNDALNIVGPSDDGLNRASEFLALGEGRCYAHTLCFAAAARMMGLPTRAIGGIGVSRDSRIHDQSDVIPHTWNQVFIEGLGWVDIDATPDDEDDGNHTFDHLGYRTNNHFITFAGNYDTIDYENVFTKRNWYRAAKIPGERRPPVDLQVKVVRCGNQCPPRTRR